MKIKPFRLPFGTTAESVARGDHTHPEYEGLADYAVKTENEARNSTTTLAADSTLIAPLGAGTKYLIRGTIYLRAANSTMDVKYDLVYDGGLSSREVGIQKHIGPGLGASSEEVIVS